MKPILIKLIFIMTFTSLFAQNKNYKVEKNSVKTVETKSDYTILKIEKQDKISQETKNNSANIQASLVPFLVGQIPKIPQYISKIVENNKKKYVAEHNAKNSVDFKTDEFIPSLTFERYINTTTNDNVLATKIVLKPKIVQDKYLAFYIDTISLPYSKAKLKNDYTHLVLLIEITAIYGEIENDKSIKKTEVKSSSLKIPVNVASNKEVLPVLKENLSDTFTLNNILEISVKVTETNPFKIKLEKIESFIANNNEDLSGLFSEISKLLKKE